MNNRKKFNAVPQIIKHTEQYKVDMQRTSSDKAYIFPS